MFVEQIPPLECSWICLNMLAVVEIKYSLGLIKVFVKVLMHSTENFE